MDHFGIGIEFVAYKHLSGSISSITLLPTGWASRRRVRRAHFIIPWTSEDPCAPC